MKVNDSMRWMYHGTCSSFALADLCCWDGLGNIYLLIFVSLILVLVISESSCCLHNIQCVEILGFQGCQQWEKTKLHVYWENVSGAKSMSIMDYSTTATSHRRMYWCSSCLAPWKYHTQLEQSKVWHRDSRTELKYHSM